MEAVHHRVARQQGGVVHRRQLRELGIDRQRLAGLVGRGQLIEVRRDVYVAAGAPPTWAQRAWIELLQGEPGAPLSHRTASRLHRVGRIVVDDIDVLEREPGWHRPALPARHRTTYLPSHHVTEVDGFPVTTLDRTVFDLCGLVSAARRRRGLPHLWEGQVARALDDALASSLTVAAAGRVLAEMGRRGRPGTRLMRQLMAERGDGYVATESELEDLVVAVLAAAGLPRPLRQRPLGSDEAPIGRVDFVYLDERVVIEANGRRHHTALLDADRDRWRDTELAAAGWVVVRVTWRQLVHEPERFLAALRRLLERRRTQPDPSHPRTS